MGFKKNLPFEWMKKTLAIAIFGVENSFAGAKIKRFKSETEILKDKKLLEITLMKEVRLIVIEKYEVQYRQMSKSIALFLQFRHNQDSDRKYNISLGYCSSNKRAVA